VIEGAAVLTSGDAVAAELEVVVYPSVGGKKLLRKLG
jgi:hypothetical protein